MVADLSIKNEKNQNDSMNDDTRDEDENMMEVDGPADTTTTDAEPELEPYDDEEEASLGNLEKIQEFYVSGSISAGDNEGAVDTVIIFETLEPVNIANISSSPNSAEHRDFMSLCSRVIEDYLTGDETKPVVHLTQEQLLIDWLTSRHLLTNNDDDD